MTAILWEPYLQDLPDVNNLKIAQYEAAIGKILPDDYKQALLQHQGKSTGRGIRVSKKSRTTLGPLLFVGNSGNKNANLYSLERSHANIVEWSGEQNLIPITSNTSTGYFCFDYRGTDRDPKIVFVDMSYDLEELAGGLPVADSFSQLLEKLEP